MKLVIGIECLDTPALFAAARRRIILHAAVYGAFARSPRHCDGLREALEGPDFQRLDVIGLEPGRRESWAEPFLKALRFGISRQGVDEEVDASHQFLAGLADEHPDKVFLHPARALPCLPMIVADDTIVFGQYAHAEVHAPYGFWGMVRADVRTLLDWAETGRPPLWASPGELAAFRLVNECVRAMSSNP